MKKPNSPVLVLNSSWLPLRVCSVKRALKLVFRDKAKIVDAFGKNPSYQAHTWEEWVEKPISRGSKYIRGSHVSVLLPEVIVLTMYGDIPKYTLRLSRKNVSLRDNLTCQYSGKKLDFKEADIDHIIPKSKGGKTVWENVVFCSKEINRKKGNKTLEEAGLKLLKKPNKPDARKFCFDLIRKDGCFSKKHPESWKFFLNFLG